MNARLGNTKHSTPGSERGVDEDPGRLTTQPVVLQPRLAPALGFPGRDVRGQVQYSLGSAHLGCDRRRIEQVELLVAWRVDPVTGLGQNRYRCPAQYPGTTGHQDPH